jgi:hypothetical protein
VRAHPHRHIAGAKHATAARVLREHRSVFNDRHGKIPAG